MTGRNRWLLALFVGFLVANLSIGAPRAQDSPKSDREAILAIHEALLASHLANDAEGVLAAEGDGVVVVSRGEVLHPTRQVRAEQFAGYLARCEFAEYRDLIEPIVEVSADGTLGWLIAQVGIRGVRTDDAGDRQPFASTWAWIVLYRKHEGRWLRVGEVSNRKPDPGAETD